MTNEGGKDGEGESEQELKITFNILDEGEGHGVEKQRRDPIK